jgi:hypothetical protein
MSLKPLPKVNMAIYEKPSGYLKLIPYKEANDRQAFCFKIPEWKVEEIQKHPRSKKSQEFLKAVITTRFLYECV